MMMIQVYVWTTDPEEEEDEKFYDQIQFEIDRICKQDVLLGVEDWNFKVANIKEGNIVQLYGTKMKWREQLINFC